jgi:predicted lipid-binding transport protein (Tim44 family)
MSATDIQRPSGQVITGRPALTGAGQGAWAGLLLGLPFGLWIGLFSGLRVGLQFDGAAFLGVLLCGLVVGTLIGAWGTPSTS